MSRELTRQVLLALLCTRMRLVIDGHHVLDRELGIALRGREALVAEEFLDGAQVGSFFEHVGAEGVAKRVRMHFGRKSFGDRDALDDAAHAAGREAASALVDEQRRLWISSGVARSCWRQGSSGRVRRAPIRRRGRSVPFSLFRESVWLRC